MAKTGSNSPHSADLVKLVLTTLQIIVFYIFIILFNYLFVLVHIFLDDYLFYLILTTSRLLTSHHNGGGLLGRVSHIVAGHAAVDPRLI